MTAPRFGEFTEIKLLGGRLLQRDPTSQNVAHQRKLTGIKRRALNLQPVFESFIPVWQDQEAQVFAVQGAPQPWPALSPLYAARKAQSYPGKTILRRTDRLYSSVTSNTGDSVAEATPRTLKFGTRVPYWIYHQTGTSRMPARPLLVLLPRTFDTLVRMVRAHLKGEGIR